VLLAWKTHPGENFSQHLMLVGLAVVNNAFLILHITQALADWERVLNLQVEWRKREERIQVQEGGSVAAEDVMLREEAYFGAEIERLSTLLAAIKDGLRQFSVSNIQM